MTIFSRDLPARLLALLFAVTMLVAAAPALHAQQADQSGAASSDALPPDEAKMLADLLKDDKKRAALIKQLERAGDETPGQDEAQDDSGPESVGRKIAETTTAVADRVTAGVANLANQLAAAPEAMDAFRSGDVSKLLEALQALAVVIVSTLATYLFLRFWAKRAFIRIDDHTSESSFWRRFAILLGTTIMDAVIVLLACGAGYVAAMVVSGEVGLRQSLYLNAFLIVGLIKVGLRALLAPSAHRLRLINVPDKGAKVMSLWFGVIVQLMGYGQLLLVPIANRQVSQEVGRALSILIALIAVLIAAGLAIRWRRAVANWLLGSQPYERNAFFRFMARNWNIPVLLYLVGLFGVIAARPDGVIWPVIQNSAEVLAVIVLGFITSSVITRSIAKGVRLPARVNEKLPLLERRLNAFVPRALMVIRALIVIAVFAFALDALEVVDVSGWLDGGAGAHLTGVLFSVWLIVVVSFIVWLALNSWVDYRLNPLFGTIATTREVTLLTLFRNAATIVLIVITLMFVLSEIGIDIAPLIASAGVIGLAVGFGAQKMVQDIITGVFIQFENAMNVGDTVTIGGTTGTVEKLTIRSVSLRDVYGAFHIIPFSSVDMVTNFVRGYGNYVADIGIAYRENVEDGKAAMIDAFTELKDSEAWGQHVLDQELQWFGVQALGDNAVVLRGRIKCAPGQQWAVGRAYNEICKRIMDEREIEIPFPQQTIWFGVDRSGDAPAARVRVEGRKGAAPAETAAPAAPQSASDRPSSSGGKDAPLRTGEGSTETLPDDGEGDDPA